VRYRVRWGRASRRWLVLWEGQEMQEVWENSFFSWRNAVDRAFALAEGREAR